MQEPAVAVLVTAIASTVTSVSEAIRSLQGTIRGAEQKKELSDALGLVLSLQSRVLELQQAILGLQEENRQLRAQVREEESRAANRQKYERQKVGRSWVMVPAGQSEPYLCPRCFEAGHEAILQPLPIARFGTHYCPRCKSPFQLR